MLLACLLASSVRLRCSSDYITISTIVTILLVVVFLLLSQLSHTIIVIMPTVELYEFFVTSSTNSARLKAAAPQPRFLLEQGKLAFKNIAPSRRIASTLQVTSCRQMESFQVRPPPSCLLKPWRLAFKNICHQQALHQTHNSCRSFQNPRVKRFICKCGWLPPPPTPAFLSCAGSLQVSSCQRDGTHMDPTGGLKRQSKKQKHT